MTSHLEQAVRNALVPLVTEIETSGADCTYGKDFWDKHSKQITEIIGRQLMSPAYRIEEVS